MLKISDYSVQIDALHEEGKSAFEIYKLLGLRYPQPIYNYFRKKGWDRLEQKDYTHNTMYQVDNTFFQEINTEEKAYIL